MIEPRLDNKQNSQKQRMQPNNRNWLRRSLYAFMSSMVEKESIGKIKDINMIDNIDNKDTLKKMKNDIIVRRAKLAAETTDSDRQLGLTPVTLASSAILCITDDMIEISNAVLEKLSQKLEEVNQKINILEQSQG